MKNLRRRYPSQPIASAEALIVNDGKLLLVKRKSEPAKGKWGLPGGIVNLGERLRDTVIREVKEECGLEVEVDKLIGVVESIRRDNHRVKFHYIRIGFLAHPKGGVLRASGDAADARWVPVRKVKNYAIPERFWKFLKKYTCESVKT